jgi:hypothetical protein
MKNRNLLIISALAFIFPACSEDFFEQTIPVEIPEHTPALAVTTHFSAGDTALAAYVSYSQGILENEFPKVIQDAVVEVFKDGQPFATLPFNLGNSLYYLPLAQPLTADLSEYRLKISAPNYNSVEAVQMMPAAVPILSAAHERDGAVTPDGDKVDEITVEFQDPAGEDNYYTLSAYITTTFDTFTYVSQLYLENVDPLSEDLGDGIIALKDNSFDGKKHKWRVGSYDYASPATLTIQLHVITKDRYLFLLSARLSEDVDDNPFAEPVIIHENIEGGYGIFSLETKSSVEIEL